MTYLLRVALVLGACGMLGITAAGLAAENESAGISKSDIERVKGDVGIAVVDATRRRTFMVQGNKAFPMQSVCKLPLSIAVLRLVDAGKLDLNQKITIRKSDISPYHSPIREAIHGEQAQFAVRELITRAVCDSDNTACDVLIAKAGGPAQVTRLLREAGVDGVRIDRPESKLQPDSKQIAKFIADYRDTSSPSSMVRMLEKLHAGKLLSKESTALIMDDLFNCKTGPNRLRAGLPSGWKLAHKTGTGADVAGKNAGTNDVGIMVGPNGQIIYVAVFTIGSRANIEAREKLMAKVAALAAAEKI